ncbi:MAG: efflux RND transporter periplasmic adaptor subunit [Gammaproteobacteria bacterium]
MRYIKYISTAVVVLIAAAFLYVMYSDYVTNPWTRNGQIKADVVQVAPRVSGPIIELNVRDNQKVKAGDLLWRIDPRTFKATLDQEQAQLAYNQAALAETKDEEARAKRIREKNPGAISEEELNLRINKRIAAEANIELSKAQIENARLNLEFTEVRAPVDGYVTNLNLQIGSQSVANQPAMALVDINSFQVYGFFRENYIADIEPGNRAVVTLMSYPDRPIKGTVDSLGWGIAQQDGSTGNDLLPSIAPTFEWIRLAQRVPVLINLDELPEGVELRVGTTASVLVLPGTTGSSLGDDLQTAPRLLQ